MLIDILTVLNMKHVPWYTVCPLLISSDWYHYYRHIYLGGRLSISVYFLQFWQHYWWLRNVKWTMNLQRLNGILQITLISTWLHTVIYRQWVTHSTYRHHLWVAAMAWHACSYIQKCNAVVTPAFRMLGHSPLYRPTSVSSRAVRHKQSSKPEHVKSCENHNKLTNSIIFSVPL
jgi:hypothetical protein